MIEINIDASEVDRLGYDLTQAPLRVQRRSRRVMLVAANKIKKGMQADASGHGHLPHLSGTVEYERDGENAYLIGFTERGQGFLDNIAAFGSVNNAPVLDHTAALHREAPFILRALGAAAEDSVLGGAE